MKHLLTGLAFAALVATAFSGTAEAKRHHIRYYYGWWGWGPPVYGPTDFVANQMNRRELGLIAYNGALGMDQIMLNPQPLPPKR
jgi:hypothetical protein